MHSPGNYTITQMFTFLNTYKYELELQVYVAQGLSRHAEGPRFGPQVLKQEQTYVNFINAHDPIKYELFILILLITTRMLTMRLKL